jgi:hypothetical protein
MGDDIAPILEKIKKLFALSGSSNPNEAASAAAKAQALLMQHNLTMAHLEATPEEDEYRCAFIDTGVRVWSRSLLNTLALNNFCVLVYDRRMKKSALIGKKTDREVVVVLYHSLLAQLQSMAAIAYGESRSDRHQGSWRNDFYLGAVVCIQNRLQAQKDAQAAASNACRALIVTSDAALNQAMDLLYPDAKSERQTRVYETEAYTAGREAGDRVVLNAVLP